MNRSIDIAADNNEAVAAWLERENYRRMQPVRVLIFVDQNMVRTAPDVVDERWITKNQSAMPASGGSIPSAVARAMR
jgi:hypothetical protein